jgi:hypothetical protein
MCPICEKQHTQTSIKLCDVCYASLERERRGVLAKSRQALT